MEIVVHRFTIIPTMELTALDTWIVKHHAVTISFLHQKHTSSNFFQTVYQILYFTVNSGSITNIEAIRPG
jgi:hypothetical protein